MAAPAARRSVARTPYGVWVIVGLLVIGLFIALSRDVKISVGGQPLAGNQLAAEAPAPAHPAAPRAQPAAPAPAGTVLPKDQVPGTWYATDKVVTVPRGANPRVNLTPKPYVSKWLDCSFFC